MTPLVELATLMREEGQQRGIDGMVKVADICLRRLHDGDEEVRLLTRSVLHQYAHTRGIPLVVTATLH